MKEPLAVFMTEYPIDGTSVARGEIAKAAGGGSLISKGMGLVVAEIRDFANKCLAIPDRIAIRGDLSVGVPGPANVVVIGSEASNEVAKQLMRRLRENFEVPYEVSWNEHEQRVEIATGNDEKLQPSDGEDYAMIVKATFPNLPRSSMLMIAGCHMWGSQAGAEAVVDSDVLRQVARETNGSENLAFIVRTLIVGGEASRPELDFGGRSYIKALQRKVP